MDKAFVTVNDAGADGLFYRVAWINFEGRLAGILDPDDYPWHWGFVKIENALRVARHYNESFEDDGETTRELALRLGKEECK